MSPDAVQYIECPSQAAFLEHMENFAAQTSDGGKKDGKISFTYGGPSSVADARKWSPSLDDVISVHVSAKGFSFTFSYLPKEKSCVLISGPGEGDDLAAWVRNRIGAKAALKELGITPTPKSGK